MPRAVSPPYDEDAIVYRFAASLSRPVRLGYLSDAEAEACIWNVVMRADRSKELRYDPVDVGEIGCAIMRGCV